MKKEAEIITLKGTDAIRQRYGMYIGSGGQEGVKRLFYEILGNAIDEFNAGNSKSILVKIDVRKSEFQISDTGKGIQPEKIEEAATKLHSSGKFKNDYSKFSIGQNGVGLTVVNALSENLTILVKRDGYKWEQKFSKGKVKSKLEKKEKLNKEDGTGTTVSYIPDIEIFNDISIDIKEYKKFIELSTYMNKGLEIQFIYIDKNGKKYTKNYFSKLGLRDYIKTLDNKFLLKEPLYFSDSVENDEVVTTKDSNGKVEKVKTGEKVFMETEIVIQYSKNETGIIKTYCNGLETIEGGSHETGAKTALTEVFKKAITSSNLITKKDNNIEIFPEDILDGIILLVNVKHSNAVFKSQTKDALNLDEVRKFVKETLVRGLNEWISKNSTQSKIIFQRIINAALGRMAATRAKNAKKKESKGIISGLSALSKVTLATGNDKTNKRLFVVEGDSAGGSVCDARCTKTDSVMKLRGKMLNTLGLNASKVEANKECSDLITALGCGIDNTFDINKLTHNQIISLTDADADGLHISMLLATFLFDHMPEIIKEGHFYIASAPLYKVTENGKVTFFYTNDDYNQYLTNKIFDKYSIGRKVKKDGKVVVKKFTKKEFNEFLDNTKYYKIKLENLSNFNALSSDLLEFIINNMTNDKKILGKRIKSKFNELSLKISKGILHIEGMIGDNFQLLDLNENFLDSIKDISDIISKNKYSNLVIKKDDEKYRSVFIGSLLDEVLNYATPKHRQRYKGLGEMDYDELWVTTMKPDSGGIVQIKANNMEELKKAFEIQMGSDPNKRKVFLETFKILPEDIDN